MMTQARTTRMLAAGLLAAILILAAVLRFHRLGATSFTYDAAALSNLAASLVDTGQVPLQGMASSAGMRNPALGVYLMTLPVRVSRDPLVLIGFVAGLNVLGVLGTYWLGRRYWHVGVGLLAALLLAVSPWAVQHSRGILGQDMLVPGGVLLFVFLFAWFVDGKLWALTAALVVAAALIQVHLAAMAFLPLLLALVVWQVIADWRRHARVDLWKPLVTGVALGALLYVPYVVAEISNDWENVRRLLTMSDLPDRFNHQVIDLALMTVGGRNIHALAGSQAYLAFLAGLIDADYRLDRLEEWLVLLAVVYLVVRCAVRMVRRCLPRRDALLLLWLLMPLLFFAVSGLQVFPHYVVIIFPAPYLVLAIAAYDTFTALTRWRRVRTGLAILGTTLLTVIVIWQAYLTVSIYQFLDLTDTPDGWGTPVRILQDVARTAQQMAALNPGSKVLMLCPGADPRWDECPAVFSFLAGRNLSIDFIDYNNPAFRTHQDDTETLVVLAPGDSLAAAELPHVAQAWPDADVNLRANQRAYRFFRIHNGYQDIADYLNDAAQPNEAIVLVGPGQRDALARFYGGPLPIIELPRQPAVRDVTSQELAKLTERYPRLLVLYRASEESDPQGIVESWLRTNTFTSVDHWLGRVRAVINTSARAVDGWQSRVIDVDFGDQIRLHRLTQSADTIESGDRLLLQMDWQALDLPAADYSLFVHLLDQDNRLVAQRDVPLLDHGLTTRAWTAEQVATLWVELTIPPGTPPGRYRMALGLYNSNDGQRLISGAADFVDLGSVIIDPLRDPAFETLWILRFQPGVAYSEITLTGFDRYKSGFSHAPGTPLRPGDLLRLELTWQAHVQPTQDWMLEARLVDQNNGVVASVSGDLVGEHYPSSQWKGGETVRGHYDLVLPANLAPGRLQLQLRAYPRGARQVGSWVELGPVVVQ